MEDGAESTPIRVFLLDDHEIVRQGIATVIDTESDMIVVGETGSATAAVARVAQSRPHVAVLDVRLDDGNGVAVCRDIRSNHPDTACLMLTSFADDRALVEASMAGAAGYVLKQIRGNDLVDAIRRVAGGAQLLDRATVRLAMDRLRTSEAGVIETLTQQEARVFELIGAGRSNREIANELYLAEKTVKNYVSNLLSKLGMVRRTEAAAMAARLEERERHRFK